MNPHDRSYPITPCLYCGAAVRCCHTTLGGVIVLDAQPHYDGTIALTPAGALHLLPETVALGQKIGSRRYSDHQGHCQKEDHP